MFGFFGESNNVCGKVHGILVRKPASPDAAEIGCEAIFLELLLPIRRYYVKFYGRIGNRVFSYQVSQIGKQIGNARVELDIFPKFRKVSLLRLPRGRCSPTLSKSSLIYAKLDDHPC